MRIASRLAALFRGPDPAALPKLDPYRRVVVVFTRPEKDLRQLDIALGPCVRRPGRKRPFVGVTNQEPGDPSEFEVLAGILLSRKSAGAWGTVLESGDRRLATFSDELVEAMAALNRENLRRQGERPKDYDWIFEPERAVVARWMSEASGSGNVTGLDASFLATYAWARISQERGQRLYCWSGPGFNPWTTAERVDALVGKHVRGGRIV